MSYVVKTIGEKVTMGVLLTKAHVPLTGLSPTLEIRRHSDNAYLDFSAAIAPYWVTSGGIREKVLPERSWMPGLYTWEFDQGFYDDTKQEYTAIYRNPTPYRTLVVEIFSFDDVAALDISFIKKMLANKQTLEALAPDHYVHTVFDDDKVTTLHAADITIDGGGTLETREPI